MEVNFLKRRKILKRTSALDLIPMHTIEYETREDGQVDILLPRFKKKLLAHFMESFNKKKIIHIKLDEFGTATWLMIDGKRSVILICEKLKEDFPDKLNPAEETEERVNKFLTVLYQQRFISFRQIQEENQPVL